MYVRVDFPSGRSYAAQMHNPSFPEWPPHPSRLFSALTASAYQSAEGMTDIKRSALQWLESLPAPMICAPKANLLEATVTYVPPGDSVGRKGKKNEEQIEHGVHRWRQPRYFPCAVIMANPSLYYSWPQDPDSAILPALANIATGVTHLGTSHSMTAVSIYTGEMPLEPSMTPDASGTEFLRVPAAGRLNELDDVFQRKSGLRRPVPSCEVVVPYKTNLNKSGPEQVGGFDLIPLRIAGTMHGADTAAYLGRALRRAVMSILGETIPAAVHGHDGCEHVAWLSLPDVGHSYASGRIVGVGICLPHKMDAQNRQTVLSALSKLHQLRFPDGRVAGISPISPGEAVPVALKKITWTRVSDTWSTVTPVVLDRPPKKLEEKRLCRALSQSIEMAGYNAPIEVEISTFSRFKGAPPAFTVPSTKPRYHATLRFKEPIAGPVIAGRLRYFGIGLFRPEY